MQYTPAEHVSRELLLVNSSNSLLNKRPAVCMYSSYVFGLNASLSDTSPGVSCTDISMLLLLLVRSVKSRAVAIPAALLLSAGMTVHTHEALSCIVLFAVRHACSPRDRCQLCCCSMQHSALQCITNF